MLHRIQSVSRHKQTRESTARCACVRLNQRANRATHSPCVALFDSCPLICSRVFDDIRLLAQSCNTLHAALYAQHRLYAWTDEWSAKTRGMSAEGHGSTHGRRTAGPSMTNTEASNACAVVFLAPSAVPIAGPNWTRATCSLCRASCAHARRPSRATCPCTWRTRHWAAAQPTRHRPAARPIDCSPSA